MSKAHLNHELIGSLAVFGSAFTFYLATVTIRWAKNEVHLDPWYFVGARFFVGLTVVLIVLVCKRKRIRPKRYDLLFGRALTNAIAVFCFFKAVDLTTAAEANILNMTYPIFIAILSWFFFKEKDEISSYIVTLVSLLGIWLVLWPGDMSYNLNNLWGLASGITAAFAIILLNMARQDNDTDTTLLFVFAVGCVFSLVGLGSDFRWPTPLECYYLLLSSLLGVAGQYLLTEGFRYVTALEGGVLSSTRILLAAILGPFLAAEPALTASGYCGALLIFAANVYLTWNKTRSAKKNRYRSNEIVD